MARLWSVLAVSATIGAACAGSGTNPAGPTPAPAPLPTSSLTYQVPAARAHGAASGTYTTANATFRGSVRTTCVPTPTFAGSVCPDLMVLVQPVNETFCQLWVFAPAGETLAVGSYPRAQRGPGTGVAGLSFKLRKRGHHVQLVGRSIHAA